MLVLSLEGYCSLFCAAYKAQTYTQLLASVLNFAFVNTLVQIAP